MRRAWAGLRVSGGLGLGAEVRGVAVSVYSWFWSLAFRGLGLGTEVLSGNWDVGLRVAGGAKVADDGGPVEGRVGSGVTDSMVLW